MVSTRCDWRRGLDLCFVRLVLGGLFLFAAVIKLQDPQAFATAIKAFRLLPTDVIVWPAFIIPWMELVLAVALVAGLWSRSAALGLALLLIAFGGAMVSVMARGLDVECGCFGRFFGQKVGWESLVRNVVFLALAAPVVARGGGALALDGLIGRGRDGDTDRTAPGAPRADALD